MKRMSIDIPGDLEKLAETEHRSVNGQAQIAFTEHISKFRGNSKDRRKARRKARAK